MKVKLYKCACSPLQQLVLHGMLTWHMREARLARQTIDLSINVNYLKVHHLVHCVSSVSPSLHIHCVSSVSPSLHIQLAAMQYQTYFLDRTQQQSTTAHHKVSEFLPFEYTTARNVEEKVLKEQMTIRSYSRQQAQDSYVHDACTLPTYRVVFFPVKVRVVVVVRVEMIC